MKPVHKTIITLTLVGITTQPAFALSMGGGDIGNIELKCLVSSCCYNDVSYVDKPCPKASETETYPFVTLDNCTTIHGSNCYVRYNGQKCYCTTASKLCVAGESCGTASSNHVHTCQTKDIYCNITDTTYNCEAGYYGNPKNTTSGCTQCPTWTGVYTNSARTTLARGTSAQGSTAITNCFIQSGTYYDVTGTFKTSSKCDYKS